MFFWKIICHKTQISPETNQEWPEKIIYYIQKKGKVIFSSASVDPQLALTLTLKHLISPSFLMPRLSARLWYNLAARPHKKKVHQWHLSIKLSNLILSVEAFLLFLPPSYSPTTSITSHSVVFLHFLNWTHITQPSLTTQCCLTSYTSNLSSEKACLLECQGFECNPRQSVSAKALDRRAEPSTLQHGFNTKCQWWWR